MATVPPADRTSPSLDPRYDALYQRGYADGSAASRAETRPADRPAEPRPIDRRLVAPQSAERRPEPAPSAEPRLLTPPSAAAAGDPSVPVPAPTLDGAPGQTQQPVAPGTAERPPAARLRTGPLWLVSVLLIAIGVLLHFTSAATGYGTDWSVFTQDGSLRFADGRSVEQVLAAQLAVAVAPQLVVLGVATAVATLFLTILRSERGTR